MIRDHDGREDREAGFKPLINVVPLIGVLAAVMVVMMVAIPGRSTTFDNDFTVGCFLCVHGECDRVEYLKLEVGASGLVRANGHEMPAAQIRQALRLPPQIHDFRNFQIEISADTQVEYSDLMQVVRILQELGLADHQIRIQSRDE